MTAWESDGAVSSPDSSLHRCVVANWADVRVADSAESFPVCMPAASRAGRAGSQETRHPLRYGLGRWFPDTSASRRPAR
jgi:hypothetical protein